MGARSPGAERRRGPPSGRSRPPRPDAPPRTRVGGGLLAAPNCPDYTAEPRGFGGCLGAPGRTQVSRREPASRARVIPTPVQDAELFSVSRLHDPEHFGRRKESAPCQHLQPRWTRHDPLLLCQCGHLAERHQPAVSPSLQMLRKFAFPSGFSRHSGARISERGRKRSRLAARSRCIWSGWWGGGVRRFVEGNECPGT